MLPPLVEVGASRSRQVFLPVSATFWHQVSLGFILFFQILSGFGIVLSSGVLAGAGAIANQGERIDLMTKFFKLILLVVLNVFVLAAVTGLASARDVGASADVEASVDVKALADVELSAKEVSATSITLEWKAEGATRYELYSNNKKVTETTDTSFTQSDLTPQTKYSYYVIAYTEDSSRQSETIDVTTAALKTTIRGIRFSASKKARFAYTDAVIIKEAMGKPIYLQYYNKKKWVTKRTFKTAKTMDPQTIKVNFPKLWWTKEKTKWRLKAGKFTSKTITLKTKRYYQNPKRYLQLKNKISEHGLKYYVYPCQVNNASTRKDHVKAMIKAAKKYLGDPYVIGRSRAPGKGVDCSGIVMQAAYAAGADLWPSNPYRHRFPKYEYESRNIAKMKKLKTVSYSKKKKGDLIFYSMGGRVVHVAIYIGKGKIIHSYFGGVMISRAKNPKFGYISKVKRIFI